MQINASVTGLEPCLLLVGVKGVVYQGIRDLTLKTVTWQQKRRSAEPGANSFSFWSGSTYLLTTLTWLLR